MSDRNGEEIGSKRPLDGGGDFGNAKRARPSRNTGPGGAQRIELRLLIPISSAGAIIGKGGTNIREMREKFSASIQIPDSHGVERVVNASGFNSESLSSLSGRIVAALNEGTHTKNQEVRILVHKSQAGTIIGVKGFKIKELRESTGASIKVFQDCCPNSTDRICQVRGTNDTIVKCVKQIIDLLETAPPKGQIQNYDPNNFDESYDYGGYSEDSNYGGGGGGMGGPGNYGGGQMNRGGNWNQGSGPGFMGQGRARGGGHGGRGNFGNVGSRSGGFRGGRGGSGGGGGSNFYGGAHGNNFSNDSSFNRQQSGGFSNFGSNPSNNQSNFSATQEKTTKVTIPTNLAGSIIGRGGSRIRQIRQDCGAQIKIDEPLPGSNDRIITITGTQEQIQNAQYLLQRSVKMYSGEKF